MKGARGRPFVAIVCIACLSILLGALLNVAVTWRIATRPSAYPFQATTFVSEVSGPHWMYQQREAFGQLRLDGTPISGTIARSTTLNAKPPPHWSKLAQPAEESAPAAPIFEEGFGWPMVAFTCEWVRTGGGPGIMRAPTPVGAFALSAPHPHDRTRTLALPLSPAWRGIVLNTLLFAIALLPVAMLLRFGWRQGSALRRRTRQRRGRCPACGYDLKGQHDIGCPECGWNRAT